MNKPHTAFTAMLLAGMISGSVHGQSISHSVQLDVSDQQRVVVSIQIDDLLLQGNAQFTSPSGNLPVDGLVPNETGNGSGSCQGGECPNENEGGTGTPHYVLLPEWGVVTINLECNNAHVVLYTEVDNQTQLVLEDDISTDYCSQ